MPFINRIVLTEKSFVLHYPNGLKCTECGYEFKVGDVVYLHLTKRERRYLCEECYESMFIDV